MMVEINYFVDIVFPTAIFFALAWCIPTCLARFVPMSVTGLFINLICSAGIMITSGTFYMWLVGGIDAGEGFMFLTIRHSARFALIWAPVLILALIVQPQKWRPVS